MTARYIRSLLPTLMFSWPLMAAEGSMELVTDRPDATESSRTVAPGYLQFEVGYTHFENDKGGADGDSVPETLVRIGLVDDLELRLGFAGYQWVRQVPGAGTPAKDDGAGDPEVGLKVQIRDEAGWMPEMAVLTHVTLPAGEAPFSGERFDPSYRFAFSHTLNKTFSLGYNLGQAWVSAEDGAGDRDTRSVFQYTAALGIGLNDGLGAFVEFYGDIPTGSGGGGPANVFDGGFTWLLSDNVQWDIAAGAGLSEAADDWFIGTGLSIRIPN